MSLLESRYLGAHMISGAYGGAPSRHLHNKDEYVKEMVKQPNIEKLQMLADAPDAVRQKLSDMHGEGLIKKIKQGKHITLKDAKVSEFLKEPSKKKRHDIIHQSGGDFLDFLKNLGSGIAGMIPIVGPALSGAISNL